MRIDLDSIDKENFLIKSGHILDIPCFLVTPSEIKSSIWTCNNLIFRSSIWTSSGELISAGFKKFFNYLENSHLYPDPNKYSNWQIIEKIDGSLMICDYINNQLSIRTRGTFSYSSLENFKDFEIVSNKFLISSLCKDLIEYSFLFEIVTPNNKIVLNYGSEIIIYLIGAINKNDYSYLSQSDLDTLAGYYNFRRPIRYDFDNLENISSEIKSWKGKEGVVLYYGEKESNLLKFKADHYLLLHRIKSKININSLLDLYLDLNEPSYEEFYNYLKDTFDYEIAESSINIIKKILIAKSKINKIINSVNEFVEIRKHLDRKYFASEVSINYKNFNPFFITSIIFSLYDKKDITKKQKEKLYNFFYEN